MLFVPEKTDVRNKPQEDNLMNKTSSRIARHRTAFIAVAAFQALLLAQAIAPAPVAAMIDNRFLDMDLAQLMQVTITSVAKRPQTLADTAAAVYVISQEDIRRSGVTSIPEAIALAPGLYVARISSSKWSISSRGFGGYTSNKLLVLIDGRSVYTPAYSGTFWDMQNTLLEDIDRIEVIRGPGGTIWGANAVNGVINIITKKAQDTQGTLLRAGTGNQERFMGGARHGAKLGDTTYARLYITGNDRAANVLPSGEDAYDGWNTLQTGFRADGTIGGGSVWTLQGDLFRNDGNQVVFPLWVDGPPYIIADYDTYSASGGNLVGQWQHQFSEGDRFSLKAYYDYNERQESYYEQKFRTFDLDLQYETVLGELNNIIMGVGYRLVDGAFDNTFSISIPDQNNDLYSAFFQDEITLISDRLWLTLGVKYEHNDFTGGEWQPGCRLLWKPATDHTLWGAITRAVRTPSIVENSGEVTITSMPSPWGDRKVTLKGNPDFDAETLVAYEAGYRWQARPDLFVDVATYYNDYNDLYTTTSRTDPFDPGLELTNNRSGYGYGLEVSSNWQPRSWLKLVFTYQYQRFEFQGSLLLNDVTGALIIDDFSAINTPRNKASFQSSIDFARNWQFNAWLRYMDEIQGRRDVDLINLTPVDAHFLLDANIIWKPKENIEVMFAGQNLLNSSQLEYIAELITPATEIKRGFFAKITWNF
jgi:iron complex outermembrane recepter protein